MPETPFFWAFAVSGICSSPVTRMISGFLKHLRCFKGPVFLHLTATGKIRNLKIFFASQTETTFIPGIFSGLQIPRQLSARSSTVLFLPVLNMLSYAVFLSTTRNTSASGDREMGADVSAPISSDKFCNTYAAPCNQVIVRLSSSVF